MSNVQASIRGFVHAVLAEEQNSYTATTEFADNSLIDAAATKLDIKIKKKGCDTYLAIRDNGTGIDDNNFNKLTTLYDTNKTGDNSQCGEFGVGLPSAALYLGSKTIIVSNGHSNHFSETEFPQYNHDIGVGSSYEKLIKEIFGEYDENFTYIVIRLREEIIHDFDDLNEYRKFLGSIYSEKLIKNDVSIYVNGVVVVPQKFVSDDSINYTVNIIDNFIEIDNNRGQSNWFQPIEMTNKDGTKTDILTQGLFENGKPGRILKKVDEPKEKISDISDIIEFDVIIDKKIYSYSEGTNGFMISTTNMRNSTQLPIPSKRSGSSVDAEDIKKSRMQINIHNKHLNKQSNKSRQYHKIETNFKNPYIYNVVAFLFQKRVNELKKINKKKADAAILANTTKSHTNSHTNSHTKIDDEQSEYIVYDEHSESIDDDEQNESIDDGEQNEYIDDDEQSQSIDDEHSESIDNDEIDVPIVGSLPDSHRRHVRESAHNRFTKTRVESILGQSIPNYINNLPDNEKEAFETKLCRTIFKMCWQKYKHGQGIDEWLYTTAVQTGFHNLTNSYLGLLWDKLPGDDVIGGAILKDFIDDNMTFIE